MSEIDLVKFYTDVGRMFNSKYGYDQGYSGTYGERRQRDAHYAIKIDNFEIIPVDNKMCSLHPDAPVPYSYIYNHKSRKPDLQYLIAPDTRVPNYTTNLDDCMELARKIGMKTLDIPSQGTASEKNFIQQILTACDKVVCAS